MMSTNSFEGVEKRIENKQMRKKFHALPTHKKITLIKKVRQYQERPKFLKWFLLLVFIIALYFLFFK